MYRNISDNEGYRPAFYTYTSHLIHMGGHYIHTLKKDNDLLTIGFMLNISVLNMGQWSFQGPTKTGGTYHQPGPVGRGSRGSLQHFLVVPRL